MSGQQTDKQKVIVVYSLEDKCFCTENKYSTFVFDTFKSKKIQNCFNQT